MVDRLDLLIINPSGAHGIYGELGSKLIAVEPPLWARLIAGYVLDAGFTVRIIDAEALGWSPERVARTVERVRPRLTCIAVYGHQPSASTQQMDGARAMARALRVMPYPLTTIMLGGHVSALPERTLREEPIHYACAGEGPATIVGLLSLQGLPSKADLAAIPGLVWWSNNFGDDRRPIVNPTAPLLDIDTLHGNVWHLLPMNEYRAHNWQCFGNVGERQPYASIHTSLGCPYKCSFCCINAPFQSHKYRMRKPADVVAEVEHLYKTYGIKTFKVIDEMFVLNERHYSSIALGLIDLQERIGVSFNFWAYARVDTVKPDTLSLLRSAGIRWLALGIESADPRVRDGATKQMRNDDIKGVVRAIQAAGINVIGNYIFGLRDDDYASMGATFALACELNTEFANFYSAMAYPGSPLYQQAIEQDLTLPESWRGYSQHNDDCRPLDTKHLTGAEVLRFRDDAFNAYFSRPAYIEIIQARFGDETVSHIREMLTYKLQRKLLQEAAE